MERPHLPSQEMLYQRRERLLKTMFDSVGMAFELEKNLANPDGMTESGAKELEDSRKVIHSELNAAWLQLEQLDRENSE
jgi:hypothetical protein